MNRNKCPLIERTHTHTHTEVMQQIFIFIHIFLVLSAIWRLYFCEMAHKGSTLFKNINEFSLTLTISEELRGVKIHRDSLSFSPLEHHSITFISFYCQSYFSPTICPFSFWPLLFSIRMLKRERSLFSFYYGLCCILLLLFRSKMLTHILFVDGYKVIKSKINRLAQLHRILFGKYIWSRVELFGGFFFRLVHLLNDLHMFNKQI